MTKQLPWVTTPTTTPSTKDVGQPSYGVIKIPFYGSVTPNEELQVASYMLSLKEQQSMSEAKIDLVTILLKLRCDNSWTRDDTIAEIKSFQLIEDLYQFFVQERNRWQTTNYLLKVEGKGVGSVVKYLDDYAQQVGACVALDAEQQTYFVFAAIADVPQGYQVTSNFTHVPSDSATAPKLAEAI